MPRIPFRSWRNGLTLAILALLPWQARLIAEEGRLAGAPWEQGTVSLFAVEALLLAALFCHLLAHRASAPAEPRAVPKAFLFTALLGFAAIASVAWSREKTAALMGALRVAEAASFAYLVWASDLKAKTCAAALAAGAAVSAAFGIAQVAAQKVAPSTWLGLAEHLPAAPGTSVVETAGGRFLRAYGLAPHPNAFGGHLAVGLLAAFGLATFHETRRRLPALLALALIAASLVFSFSRSAWLGALASFVLLAAISRAAFKGKGSAAWAALVSATFVALAVAWPLVATRVGAEGRLETKSVVERGDTLRQGVDLFLERPASGVGVGNMALEVYARAGTSLGPYGYQPAHAVPVLIAAELGFFGLAAAIGLALAWAAGVFSALRAHRSSGASVWMLAPLPIFVASLFDHYPFTLEAGLLAFAAALGLSLKAVAEHHV